MMSSINETTTSVFASADDVLATAGYARIEVTTDAWPGAAARAYEDPYSIAAVVVFETWADLAASWLDAQAALVELISEHFARGEPKAWEGYLVLLTPSIVPREAGLEAVEIQRDTTHVRKLLATGDDFKELGGLERSLLPLLPLSVDGSVGAERTALDLLPQILARRGIAEDVSRATIDAFVSQEPLVERLYALTRNGDEA